MLNEDEEKYIWLCDEIEGLKEKITFRNRTEYRISGKLHNNKGPAVINKFDPLLLTKPEEDDVNEFYLKGIKLTEEEWIIYNREYKLKKLKRNIKNQ